MIRTILFLLSMLILNLGAKAQDTLLLRNGQERLVKVLEINPTEVIYKRFDNQEGPTIIVLKAEVAAIRYANGTHEDFNEEPARALETQPVVKRNSDAPTTPTAKNDLAMYNRGRMDALSYYQGNGAMWGTMAATLYPPAGLATGVVVSVIPPNPRNFYTPNPELLQHPAYVKGYQAQAHRRKIGKAATGLGIGLGVYFVAAVMILAAY